MSNLIYDIRKRADLTAYLVDDLISLDIVYPTPLAVTLANMRLSLAAGAAFVDFSSAGALTPYLGSKIEIIDSAGKKATGYIKAAGTGETYQEKISNGGFDSDTTGWEAVFGCTIASVAGGDSGNCLEITRTGGAFQITAQTVAASAGVLLVGSAKVKSGAAGDTAAQLWASTNSENIMLASAVSSGVWTEMSGKATAPDNIISFSLLKYNITAGTMLFDTASLKRVLTPSATGVTIVSTPGGSTYNWTSIETGFNYNDASGYTCQIYIGGHVYKCTTAGISAASQPTFNAGPGETTTDGTVVWTECNPSGVTYAGALTFEREFRYRDMRRRMKYAQPIDYSIAGDVYCYDKQATVARQTREISYDRMTEADYVSLLDFVAIVQGARFNFLFTDENGVEHLANLLSDTIESTPPFSGYEGEIRIELYLIT